MRLHPIETRSSVGAERVEWLSVSSMHRNKFDQFTYDLEKTLVFKAIAVGQAQATCSLFTPIGSSVAIIPSMVQCQVGEERF